MAKEYQFEHETWEPPDKELRALRKDFYGPLTQEVNTKEDFIPSKSLNLLLCARSFNTHHGFDGCVLTSSSCWRKLQLETQQKRRLLAPDKHRPRGVNAKPLMLQSQT